jgi:Family of unknown function (DUF6186)
MSGAPAGVVGVLCLIVGGLALEACARRGVGPATAGRALGAAMRTVYGRAIVFLTWLWMGVHFLAR